MTGLLDGCEVCGAPVQDVEVELGGSAQELGPTVVVSHCSSLLCPTNLQDSEPEIVL